MSALKEFGVVVVGLGIAGKVRLRDLKAGKADGSLGLNLKGFISRRSVEEEGLKSYTWEEALSQNDVHAVIVATENGTHEEYVRKALEGGKHVLVDYPMALSSKVAKQLYQLADEKSLVLHEENIALLTGQYLTVKEKAEKAKLKSATYKLVAGFNGWLEKFEESGGPFISGVTSIQTMVSLFGQLTVTGGKMDMKPGEYCAQGDLKTSYGSPISLTLERQEKCQGRHKSMIFEFEDGEVIDTEKLPTQDNKKLGLFRQDLDIFYNDLVAGKISEDQKNLSIHSLELAEQIQALFK